MPNSLSGHAVQFKPMYMTSCAKTISSMRPSSMPVASNGKNVGPQYDVRHFLTRTKKNDDSSLSSLSANLDPFASFL